MRHTTKLITILVVLVISTVARAEEHRQVAVGLDFEQPFSLQIGGNGNRDRSNLNLGVDARHFVTSEVNYGVRFGYDVEEQKGSVRQMTIAPGMARHWMPLENWRPYLRFDVPIVLRGAPNSAGSESKKDLGFSGGAGFVWKLGDAIGIDNMEFRYDIDIYYSLGLGGALSVVGLNLFRAGFDYRF